MRVQRYENYLIKQNVFTNFAVSKRIKCKKQGEYVNQNRP